MSDSVDVARPVNVYVSREGWGWEIWHRKPVWYLLGSETRYRGRKESQT